ncbi:MAG: hypothetical protein CL681_13455 [Blastopirellula sp.]|nr:hypothetical protein [Blastopirellula sp.]
MGCEMVDDAMKARASGWRRLVQIRLGTLLLFVTVCAVGLGWRQSLVVSYEKQDAAAQRLLAIGANLQWEPAQPAWLRPFMDETRFRDVVEVRCESKWLNGEVFEPIADLHYVKRLYIANNMIDDDVMACLRNCHRLERISLWQTQVTDDGLVFLKGKRQLRAVDLHSTRVTDRGVKYLSGAYRMNKLKLPSGVTDEGIRALRGLRELRELHLDGGQITAQGLAELKHAKLTTLHTNSMQISPEDLKFLCQLRYLHQLNLRDVQANPQYAERLGQMPQLRSLMIRSTLVDDDFVASLSPCPKLEALTLYGTRVGRSGVASLAKFPALRTLYLQSALLAAEDCAPLMESKNFTSLHIHSPWITPAEQVRTPTQSLYGYSHEGRMDLSRTEYDTPSFLRANELRLITRQSQLTSLGLAGRYANECDLSPLNQLAKLTELRVQRRYDTRGVTDATLARIADLGHVEKLVIGSYDVTLEGLSRLAKMKRLRELQIFHPFLSLEEKRALREAFQPPIAIDFSRTGVGKFANQPVCDQDVWKLKSHSWLRELDLSHTGLTDAGVPALGALTQLQSLKLRGTRVAGDGLESLASLVKLETLDLSATDVSGENLRPLVQLPLRSLDLSETRVTPEAFLWLVGLEQLESLRLRDLPRFEGRSTQKGWQALGQLPALTMLDLSHSEVRDQDLAGVVYCAQLESLLLEGTAVTDQGLKSLVKCPALQHLSLIGCRITLEGVRELRALKTLKSLSLAGTHVRRKHRSDVEAALPGVQVYGL